MVEGTARLAVPHQHAGHPEARRGAHQFVAGHARAAPHESGTHEFASGVVHSGRTSDLAAVASVAHGDYGEPQIQQSGGAGFSGTQPVGSPLWARNGSDDVAAFDENLPVYERAARSEMDYRHHRRTGDRADTGEPNERRVPTIAQMEGL